MTHICVSKLTIIGSDNGLSPDRRQTIIWTNTGILLIGPLGTNFSEIIIEIYIFSFKKMHMKMSSGKWQPSCFGFNVLTRLLQPNDNAYLHCLSDNANNHLVVKREQGESLLSSKYQQASTHMMHNSNNYKKYVNMIMQDEGHYHNITRANFNICSHTHHDINCSP